jgi:drug/metabolite transporter (DMT)-like permease
MLKFIAMSDHLKGTLLTLGGVLTITTDPLLLRFSSHIDNLVVQFYRYFLSSGMILFALFAVQRRESLTKLYRIGYIGFFAGLVWGVSNLLFTFAIQNAVVANVVVIMASNPMFAALFSYFMLGELIPLRTAVTCIICVGVIIAIFVNELQANPSELPGIIAAVFISLTMGLYFVLMRFASRREG